MLQSIRDRVQGWIAGTIIGLLVLTFALWGIESYLGSGKSADMVAKVNGQAITQAQLNVAYQRLRQDLLQSNSALALDQTAQAQLKQQALQQLISNQILSQAAIHQGYRVTAAQLDDVIMMMPPFQVDGRFSSQRFQQVLASMSYPQNEFILDLERSILISQPQSGITNSAFSLPDEAKQVVILNQQKRDIAYAIIPAAQFTNSVKISADAIKDYYNQHQDAFKTAETVSIDYLELSAEQLAKNLKVSDPELQQYYQDNLSAYTKNGQAVAFAQVKNDIAKILAQQKAQQAFSDANQKLADLTFTNPNTLSAAASALGLSVQTTNAFTRAGEKTGIAANAQIVTAAFSEDVLKNNNNSNVIPIKDGTVVVLRVKNYQPAVVKPLAQVTSEIQQQLQQQAAEKAAQQWAENIKTAVQKGQSLATVAQQYHLNWQQKNSASRQEPGVDVQILRAAFGLPKPVSAPAITTASLANGNAVVVAVKNVIPDMVIKPEQQQVAQGEMENNYGQLDYQLYIDSLSRQAKVKILQ